MATVDKAGTKEASAFRIDFTIEGMDCADCARTIEKAISALPGVQSAVVNFGAARLSVIPSNGQAGIANAVERTVSGAGYRAAPISRRAEEHALPLWRRDRKVITTAIGAVLAGIGAALWLLGAAAWLVDTFYGLAIIVSGFTFARAGLLAARSGRADMNLLMTVAAIGAAALGDWAEGAAVVLLFAFGGTLQAYTLEKTRGAIRGLMDLSPPTALVKRTGTDGAHEQRLPVSEVEPGEVVLVGPGERIPLDGVVLKGTTSVDQSPITGESVPVDVGPGSELYAGTINGPGAFSMRVLRAANDTTLAHIIHLVEEAQAQRAPSQQFVDRFSAVYTPLVIAAAALVAVVPFLLFAQPFGEWFYRALVLLVVACPCALVISTPVSLVAAIGTATRRGVLIKGGAALETLGQIRAIAFDKTGTLTEGKPRVVSVQALDGDARRLLEVAAAVEARSEHPLARAVAHAGREARNGSAQLEAEDFTALPGLGARARIGQETVYVGSPRLFNEGHISLDGVTPTLESLNKQGDTAILVGSRHGVSGVIGLADNLRAEAKSAVQRLKQAGIEHIIMLTGDNPRTAATIARQVGIDDYYADLLPAEKVGAVKSMVERYGSVAMVGDGINDAPALATASVGIAMGVAGTDAALEVADVALMSDDLSRLAYAALLSRKTLRIIKANIGASLAVKALALALAVLGVLPLWGAILADMGVSLLVTLNGMRLLAYRGE